MKRNRMIILICLSVIAACAASQPGKSDAPEDSPSSQPKDQEISILLNKLTSPSEAERFQALRKAEGEMAHIPPEAIERLLTCLRQKNVSTLIFALIQAENDAIYHLSPSAQAAAERSPGSFPNIAYYYARVSPEKGLPQLKRLYEKYPGQRLFICQSIGETGVSEAVEFLLKTGKTEKQLGNSLFPFLAGLRASEKVLEKNEILWFLDQDLDREELISLSYLSTRIGQKELVSLYQEGRQKRVYAIQYIFRDPGGNFEALCAIIDKAIENKNYDQVRRLMMSDSILKCEDQQVREYREAVLGRIQHLK